MDPQEHAVLGTHVAKVGILLHPVRQRRCDIVSAVNDADRSFERFVNDSAWKRALGRLANRGH
jgi:hypothetical protein